MKYGLIPNLNKRVSRVVLGMGTTLLDQTDDDLQLAVIEESFAHGINAFDTGRHYGDGLADRRLGLWLKGKKRDDVVIISKGAHPDKIRQQRVTPYDIYSDIADSLHLMEISYVDVFMLHRDDPQQLVGPIVECLHQLKKEGLARLIGVSNWSLERLQDAQSYAKEHGLEPLRVSSLHYSLAEQYDDPWGGCYSLTGDLESQDWYSKNQMVLLAYASLSMGFLSGRVQRNQVEQALAQGIIDADCVRCYCREPNFDRLERALQMAKQKDVSVAQLALAYVLSSVQLDSYALVGSSTPQEAAANARASELELSRTELSWLLNGDQKEMER